MVIIWIVFFWSSFGRIVIYLWVSQVFRWQSLVVGGLGGES